MVLRSNRCLQSLFIFIWIFYRFFLSFSILLCRSVLLSFRDIAFCDFSKNFQKTWNNFCFQNLKFFTLYLGAVRVLSGITNFASKYDCSIPCSFRDMAFFVIFQKIFRKPPKFFFLQSLKLPTLLLEAIRVLSGIANLCSNFNCSNPCSFWVLRYAFFAIFEKFSKNLN